MKPALDFFHNAARCEETARGLHDAAQRHMLTSTAETWQEQRRTDPKAN
jgi:hypothetical protein